MRRRQASSSRSKYIWKTLFRPFNDSTINCTMIIWLIHQPAQWLYGGFFITLTRMEFRASFKLCMQSLLVLNQCRLLEAWCWHLWIHWMYSVIQCICAIRNLDIWGSHRVFFSKGPTQKSSKYGIGPTQQDKMAKYTGPIQSYQMSELLTNKWQA